jgi:hypothetical protein
MEVKPAIIAILDISGYTRFIRMHKLSLIHAEGIISELLECVIEVCEVPLVLNKLQGDAALFYALPDGSPDFAQRVLQKVARSLTAFREKERELLSECQLCVCEACAQVGNLRLKAILHHGEVAFKKVQKFEELAGEDVIIAHRLLKNSIQSNEYLLLSEAFHQLSGAPSGLEPQHRKEHCEGFGEVSVTVFYPSTDMDSPPLQTTSLWKKVSRSIRLDTYALIRIFRPNARTFRNLQSSADDKIQQT